MTGARSVYVHAPFCARRCVYCDFAVSVDRSPRLELWLQALEAELGLRHEGALADPLETLFVGGGTPSLLGSEAMVGLATVLGRERLAGPDLEWTAEANPESFTPALAAAWARAGVNRISLGVQTFDPGALSWMGRLHGPDGAIRAVETARAAGLTNLSVDLIFGLPAHLNRSWSDDLARVVDLDPPHVSLYGLTVEGGTSLGRAVSEGRETVADEATYRSRYLEAAETLMAAGYVHYEVSNFAREGFESRHNLAYWTGRSYVGLGNGAHSYHHPRRSWNLRDWPVYADAVRRGTSPVADTEVLDREAQRMERIWLGLRIRAGLPEQALTPEGREACRSWVARGLAERAGDRVRLTTAGWLVLDRLAVELDGIESREDATSPATAGPPSEPVSRADRD